MFTKFYRIFPRHPISFGTPLGFFRAQRLTCISFLKKLSHNTLFAIGNIKMVGLEIWDPHSSTIEQVQIRAGDT